MSWRSRRKFAKWEYFRVRTWQGNTAHIRVDGNCWATRAFKKDFDEVVETGGSLTAIICRMSEIIRPYSGAMRSTWHGDLYDEIFISFYNRDYTDIDSLHEPFNTSKHIPISMDKEVFAVLRG